MTPYLFVFIVTAIVTLGAALMVVTARSLIHSALWLVLALFGVGAMFVLLSAGFFAVVQVVIYIGAIAILMIFAIMLTRRVMREDGSRFNRGWWLAILMALVLLTGLVWMIQSWSGSSSTMQPLPPDIVDPIQSLGAVLVSPNGFVLPFELASILLLAALIGAIVVAWERK
jgi:NADH-quinone oxidoreductase subunit J